MGSIPTPGNFMFISNLKRCRNNNCACNRGYPPLSNSIQDVIHVRRSYKRGGCGFRPHWTLNRGLKMNIPASRLEQVLQEQKHLLAIPTLDLDVARAYPLYFYFSLSGVMRAPIARRDPFNLICDFFNLS